MDPTDPQVSATPLDVPMETDCCGPSEDEQMAACSSSYVLECTGMGGSSLPSGSQFNDSNGESFLSF